jgi:hypothetical protein
MELKEAEFGSCAIAALLIPIRLRVPIKRNFIWYFFITSEKR